MHKLFLHVGGVKTGTTAIQYYFFRNPNCNGLQYLPVGIQHQGHHGIAAALMGSNRLDWLHAYSFQKLVGEIDALNHKDGANYFVSSEVFSTTEFISDGGIDKLRKLFEVWDVTVIYYFRNQIDLVESSFLQVAKTGAFVEDIHNWYEEFKRREIGNYLTKLEQFRKTFGSEKVFPVSFDIHKSNIMAPIEFITKVKVDHSKIEHANRSSVLSSLVLQSVAKDTGQRLIGPNAFRLRSLAEAFLVGDEDGTLITEQMATEIINDFHNSNSMLQELSGVNLNRYLKKKNRRELCLTSTDLEKAKSALVLRLAEYAGDKSPHENGILPNGQATFDHVESRRFPNLS